MVTYRVAFHIGIHDVIRCLAWNQAYIGIPMNKGRQQTMKETLAFVSSPELRPNLDDLAGAISQYGTMAAVRAQELFPDLARGVDLSEYNVERKTSL